MLNTGNRIMSQEKVDESNSDNSKIDSTKRKLSDRSEDESVKRNRSEECCDDSTSSSSLLDEVPNIRPEVVQPNLLFDMFCVDGSIFRKSKPVPPNYRILVRTSKESTLTAAEIAYLYRTQPKPAVPILLMLISDTLSIHCFLYNFYRLPSKLITVSFPSSKQEDVTSNENSESDDCS
ncbi:uncharacterized protein LOC131695698 [Topomyia yanbarensis]|uniref:uncharacterized protein LOC131695698 n=1 Tax=Topomyia yanbarensis TaxID=2498891 RepID=UPI00273C0066|nr:uncharacterized protein LOC131695698 [Topomyia yanbarensis]